MLIPIFPFRASKHISVYSLRKVNPANLLAEVCVPHRPVFSWVSSASLQISKSHLSSTPARSLKAKRRDKLQRPCHRYSFGLLYVYDTPSLEPSVSSHHHTRLCLNAQGQWPVRPPVSGPLPSPLLVKSNPPHRNSVPLSRYWAKLSWAVLGLPVYASSVVDETMWNGRYEKNENIWASTVWLESAW